MLAKLADKLALCILVVVEKNISAKLVLLSDKIQTEYHSVPVEIWIKIYLNPKLASNHKEFQTTLPMSGNNKMCFSITSKPLNFKKLFVSFSLRKFTGGNSVPLAFYWPWKS